MMLLRSALVCVLLLTLPVSAAEPFTGVWKMRPPSGGAGNVSQTMTIEPAAGGAVKVTTDIAFGNGQGMSMNYVTKFDGAEVPVYSAGKVVMTMRAKKTGANTYEGSGNGPGGTSTFKTTISADGKTMTTEGTTGGNAGRTVFDRVR